MKKKILAVLTAIIMAGSGITGAMMQNTDYVSAASEDPYEVTTLEGEVATTQNNYMTSDQYTSLFGQNLDAIEIDAFDPDNTDNPLDGYQPSVLSELFLGYMNRTNNYDGYFTVMENASSDSGFNMDTMWNTNYGGVNKYYGEDSNEDMYTHAINTIALTPGKLSDADARTRQQILIESRIYLEEDGAFYEDNSRQMINTYTLSSDGSTWNRKECKDLYLSDAHWAWYVDVPEQQSYTAMAVGDYDGDDYNEVAIYVPAVPGDDIAPCIEIYQPAQDGSTYKLNLENTISLTDIGARFGVEYDKYFAYAQLSTTSIAGRDDLVVSATLPYYDEDGFNDNGALAVISLQNNTANIVFNTDLSYNSNAYHFKMQATTNADLNGDGTDELVVAGFKNTGYSTRGDDRGSISDSENLVNVLLYEDGSYQLAWSEPQVTTAIDLDHSREMDAPVALAAGKYRAGSVKDTVFLEGTYLDFTLGSGDTLNDQIRNGRFTQNTSENMSGLSNATINLGASGVFVSDKPATEEVVFYTTYGEDDVDIDIVWGHTGDDGTIASDVVNDNYVDDTEEDEGTIISMCAVNVDQDTSSIKYTGKTVGWSNPVVYGILMSMPYWQELDYGDVWNDRGETDFGVTKESEDGTSITTGVDLDATVNISGEVTVFGNGVGAGIDIGILGNYAYENSSSKSLAKGITWSVGGGVNEVALMAVPVVTYQYEISMPEHQATKEEQAAGKTGTVAAVDTQIACTNTYEAVKSAVSVDTYNDIIEEFNAMAEEEDQLPLIDMDEIYKGAAVGDPSSYANNPTGISSIGADGVEGEDYLYAKSVQAQTGKSKSVETLTIETGSSSSESNGFNAGLKGSIMGKIIGGMDFMSIVSATGSVGLTVSGQVAAGKTWVSTDSTSISYSASFANLPDEAEGYGYEYSAGLVKWNASLKGFDNELSEDLPDTTVVIAPVVTLTGSNVPPALPTDLHVLGVTENTAVLEWTNPEGDRAPDYYKVYYSKDDSTYYPLDDTVLGDKTRHIVTGLSSDSVYYFKLEGYDSDTSMRSVKSAAVEATTKAGTEPVITQHPKNCYAEVGESAMFTIGAEPQTEGNTLSYQWQQLSIDDYGISWTDIDVASDSTIGRTAEFNAAYASPDGLIRQQDVDDLEGNVYRCVVAEHVSGQLDYVETISNSATLHIAGEGLEDADMYLSVSDGTYYRIEEVSVAEGSDLPATAALKYSDGMPIKEATVNFALLDKDNGNKCVEYMQATTGTDGKASVTFTGIEAGNYEMIAVTAKADDYTATVSNSVSVVVSGVYTISYELNGGINHNLNPTVFSAGTDFVILKNPGRADHNFTGWYLDKELTQLVENNILDVSEQRGEITLYAGWEKASDTPEDDGGNVPDDDGNVPDDPGTDDNNGNDDSNGPGNDDSTGNDDNGNDPDDETGNDDSNDPGTDESTQGGSTGDNGNGDDITVSDDTDKSSEDGTQLSKVQNDQNGQNVTSQTGDDSNMTIPIVILIAAVAAVLAALFLRRKKDE